MKKFSVVILASVFAVLLLSCDDEVPPAHVQGEFQLSTSGTFDINGDLAKSSAKYYGYCEKADGVFNFEVGHNDKTHVSGSDELFISVSGIVGPPQKGVFDSAGDPIDERDLYTTFSTVQITNTNSFSIAGGQWTDECDVELWATPIDGELTPETDSGGGLRKFQHYLRINCVGISVKATNSSDAFLNYFSAELYFSNC